MATQENGPVGGNSVADTMIQAFEIHSEKMQVRTAEFAVYYQVALTPTEGQ